MFQAGEPAEIRQLDGLVVIEIDKLHLVVSQHITKAAGSHQILNVAAVARSFGDDDLRRLLAAAQLDDGSDHARIGVDDLVAMIFNEIWFEHNPLARQWNARLKRSILLLQDSREIAVVVRRAGDMYSALGGQRPQSGECMHGEVIERRA